MLCRRCVHSLPTHCFVDRCEAITSCRKVTPPLFFSQGVLSSSPIQPCKTDVSQFYFSSLLSLKLSLLDSIWTTCESSDRNKTKKHYLSVWCWLSNWLEGSWDWTEDIWYLLVRSIFFPFLFNRKFLTETKRPRECVEKSEHLMWLFQWKTKKKHKSCTAPQSLGRNHELMKSGMVIHLTGVLK